MIERPLLCDWQAATSGPIVGTVIVDPAADAILSDHVYKGTPLLPAAAILEIFAEVAECMGTVSSSIVLQRVEFSNGIRCFTDSPQTLHVRVSKNDVGYDFQLTQEFRNRAGTLLDAARVCTVCHLPNRTVAFDDWGWETAPLVGWQTVHYEDGDANRMGLSLRGLQRLQLREECGWGEILALPETPWKPSRPYPWRFSPGVIDAALVACNLWVYTFRPGSLQIPMSMRRVWIGDNPPPGTKLEETFHVQQVTDMTAAYDIRVRTASGQMVLKIDDYVCSLVREPGVTPLRLGEKN